MKRIHILALAVVLPVLLIVLSFVSLGGRWLPVAEGSEAAPTSAAVPAYIEFGAHWPAAQGYEAAPASAVAPPAYAGPLSTWSAYQPLDALPVAEEEARPVEMLEFDVSEDMTRFVFDKDVAYEDGLPADGSAFITRGYLYESGTLNGDGDGVNEDGTPQYPDKLIGEWICSGYMINDAGHATGGVWVFSTQFFQFGDTPGGQTLVTQGYELADVGVAISRAITGGTGAYKAARGEGTQTMLGLNATDGVNLRVVLEVQK
jgi:hypothetical protein